MSNRKYLFHKQRGKCHYCGVQMSLKRHGKYMATEDHIIPKSKGGSGMIDNLVGACFTCNNMRGTIPYQAFRNYIQLHGNSLPMSKVMQRLTRSQYELHRDIYDAIRGVRHESHIPIDMRSALPPFIEREIMVPLVPPPEPKQTYRRNFLYLTRRKIESIIIGIPYKKRREILESETQ